jgi:hypothetical protein
MATKTQQLTIGGIMYLALFALGSEKFHGSDNDNKCGGTEWWHEKILANSTIKKIDFTPKKSTIAELTSLNTNKISFSDDRDRPAIENQVYILRNVLITEVKRENDNDYHLVIEDGKKHHMIAEIPDPDCPDARHSKYHDKYVQARKELEKYASNYRHHLFVISGPLFVDKSHGQTGHAANNVEIHPVLSLKAIN